MRRIEADRREKRDHFPQEIVVQPGALFRVHLRLREEAHALLRKPRKVSLLSSRYCSATSAWARSLTRGKTSAEGVSPELLSHAEPDALFQLGDADLEELVQVARQDAQEPQPLERRNRRSWPAQGRAGLKCQDGEFAREKIAA